MSNEVLRDPSGRILATIETRSDGVQLLYDPSCHLWGKYDPQTNVTYDTSCRRLGTGNLLLTLLPRR